MAEWYRVFVVSPVLTRSLGREIVHQEQLVSRTRLTASRLNIDFITAIPLNVEQGSGCYTGIDTLSTALNRLGIQVNWVTPSVQLPVFTARRILFNERLRWRRSTAAITVGFDADGYTIASRNSPPHIACVKGVLGDAVRFESGLTRTTMSLQAKLEALHARRAGLVITISRYCAQRLEELYGVPGAVVVPELIDLARWRERFHANPAPRNSGKFTVLSVCRFYPRKRMDLLIRAAAMLRSRIPELEIRIVGGGPEASRLKQLCRAANLDSVVHWVGNATAEQLASEYNRAHVFCLPSVQEGFGIVFLEAMAAGKPIVAARAAAVPEVVTSGILVEPESAEALALGIARLYTDSSLRESLGKAGLHDVEQFDSGRVAGQFLTEVKKVLPGRLYDC